MIEGRLRAWADRAQAFATLPSVGRAAVMAGAVLLVLGLAFLGLGLWALAAFGLPEGSRHLPFLVLAVAALPFLGGFLLVRHQLGPEPRRKRARQALLDAAKAGDPAACNALARAYLRGEPDLPRDDVSGRHWMERAARCGHPPAMIGLASLLREGRGGPRDPAAADHWLGEAKRRGAVLPRRRD